MNNPFLIFLDCEDIEKLSASLHTIITCVCASVSSGFILKGDGRIQLSVCSCTHTWILWHKAFPVSTVCVCVCVCVCVWACSLSLSTFHVRPGMKQSTPHTLTHCLRPTHSHTCTNTNIHTYIHTPTHCSWVHIQSKEAVFYSSSCLFEWILHNALGITSHTRTQSNTHARVHSERNTETLVHIVRPDFYSCGHGIITHTHKPPYTFHGCIFSHWSSSHSRSSCPKPAARLFELTCQNHSAVQLFYKCVCLYVFSNCICCDGWSFSQRLLYVSVMVVDLLQIKGWSCNRLLVDAFLLYYRAVIWKNYSPSQGFYGVNVQ